MGKLQVQYHGKSGQSPAAVAPTPQQAKATAHMGGRILGIAKLCLVTLVAGSTLMALKRALADPALIQALLEGAHSSPTTIIPLFFIANVISPIALVPAAPFLLLAGAIWGIPIGLAISGTATLISNLCMFALGRGLLRQRILKYITANVPSFPSIQAAIVAEGWRLVLMLRIAPILPDSVMNYMLSITDVSAGVFAGTTTATTLAWSLLYLYLGSASKDIVATLSGGVKDDSEAKGINWNNVALTGVSVAVGVGVLVYVFRVIKAAIDKAAKVEGAKKEEAKQQ